MLDRKEASYPAMQERVEIDTSLPFESVKAAVSLFGEKVELNRPKLTEKYSTKGVENIQEQGELVKIKEQLENAERLRIKALNDLEEEKKTLEHMRVKLTKETEHGIRNEENHEATRVTLKEVHNKLELQSSAEQGEHTTKFLELESAKQELALLKKDLKATLEEKDVTLKETEELLSATDNKMKTFEDLNKEIGKANESLVLLKLACIEANRDKIALLEAKQTGEEAAFGDKIESSRAKEELVRERQLENKLAATLAEVRNLQAELTTAKGKQTKALSNRQDALAALEALNLDIERTRMAEESIRTSLKSLVGELEEVRATLQKKQEDIASLQSVLETVRADSGMMRELTNVKEREANATAAASVLKGDLTKMRNELIEAEVASAKATEAISGLSQAFEQVKMEAAEARVEAEALMDEASRAKDDASKADAARQDAESKLQTALLEADSCKSAEAAALEHLKSLSTKAYATRASEVEAGAGITISVDEYESLKRKTQEAADIANMKVVAAVAQVEAVRASEQEILRKLLMISEDTEGIKSTVKQALLRAEMAAAAKSAVESELKRLRDREQARKEKEMAFHSQQLFIRKGDAVPAGAWTPPIGTSAQMASEKPDEGPTLDRTTTQKKRLAIFGSFLSRRKSFSSRHL